jgi:hypothetical protein
MRSFDLTIASYTPEEDLQEMNCFMCFMHKRLNEFERAGDPAN